MRLHLLALAGQEVLRLLHQLGVALVADLVRAGPGTALDLVEQTGPGARLEDAVGTGADEEGALQRVDRAADGAGRGEGAEIVALAGAGAAMLEDRRGAVVAGDQDIGKRLVVAQQHVKARPQALDQIGFQQQRLGLGARRDELHVRRLAHHLGDAVGMHAAQRIVADALLQAAGLADVEHVARLVEHAVDAGAVRQPLDEFGDQFRADEAGFVDAACVPVDRQPKSARRRPRLSTSMIVVALIRLVVKNAAIAAAFLTFIP